MTAVISTPKPPNIIVQTTGAQGPPGPSGGIGEVPGAGEYVRVQEDWAPIIVLPPRPMDGQIYGMQDGEWVVIGSGGSVGPAGPPGPQGEPGPAGDHGTISTDPPSGGVDGDIWYQVAS